MHFLASPDSLLYRFADELGIVDEGRPGFLELASDFARAIATGSAAGALAVPPEGDPIVWTGARPNRRREASKLYMQCAIPHINEIE